MREILSISPALSTERASLSDEFVPATPVSALPGDRQALGVRLSAKSYSGRT